MTLLQHYATYVAASQRADLPAAVRHHAQRALLDWLGALMAGSQSEAAVRLRLAYADELLSAPLTAGLCSVAGTAAISRPRAAAFLNGTISHIAEFDDIFRDGIYHPASPTISAAFALAQARGLGLEALLKAIVAGYEVSTRIAQAVQPSHYTFFHTTGTAGVFGAAAACASLLQLTPQQACDAMATAGTFASGLQQAFRSDSMTKPMHAGHAAEVGLNAALTAQANMSGTPDLLEGAAGFGAAMSQQPRWETALDGLGQQYNIARMTFKNHGCCGHTFAAIDGVAALVAQHQLKPADIAGIHLGCYRAAAEVCTYRAPTTPFEAKFSLSYTVAAAVVLGRVRELAFTVETLADPVLRNLERRVTVEIDADCTRTFPSQRSARVAITLVDGRVLERHQTTRHGDPDDPLTDAELLDKFYELCTPRTGEAAAQAMAAIVLAGSDVPLGQLTQHWAQASV